MAVAFANPAKVWDGVKWESDISFKAKTLSIHGYGVQGSSLITDVLNTAWAHNIR